MEDHLGQYTHQTYWGKENQNQIKDPFLDPQQRQMMEYMSDDVPESKIEQHSWFSLFLKKR